MRRLGPYQVLSELGRGSDGIVYRAFDPRLERPVALKVLAGDTDSLAAQRFLVEARAIARLKHPNVVSIYEVNVYAGLRVLVLELVEGGSLRDRLAAGPLAAREAALLVRDLAFAVQAAHDAGLVHRDLKPGNVLLEPGTLRPRLTDFGLALDKRGDSTDEEGFISGTPAYMAPESLDGTIEELGPWTDVWGLGAILHQALSGKPPFGSPPTLKDTFAKVRMSSPDAIPGIPEALDRVRRRALAKDPEARFESARAVAEALEGYLAGESNSELGGLHRAEKTPRTLQLAAALTAASLILVLIAAFSDRRTPPSSSTPEVPLVKR